MHLPYAHTAAALAWVLTTCAAGTAVRLTSLSDWSLLVCLATIPAVVLTTQRRVAPAPARRRERRDVGVARQSGRP